MTDSPSPSTVPLETGDHAKPIGSLGALLKRLGPAGVLTVIASTVPALGSIIFFAYATRLSLWLRELGSWGPIVYGIGFALTAGLALLPTYALSAVGGYALGLNLGAPAAVFGCVVGAILGYEVAARASGDRVVKLINENPKAAAIYRALTGTPGHRWARTLGTVILLRLPPTSPFALMNMILASARVPRSAYILGTAIGLSPRGVLAVYIGAAIHDAFKEALEQASPRWIFWVGLGVTAVVVLAVGEIARRAVHKVAIAPSTT